MLIYSWVKHLDGYILLDNSPESHMKNTKVVVPLIILLRAVNIRIKGLAWIETTLRLIIFSISC